MDHICLSTIVYCSNESSKNFFSGNSIQTSAFCPSFIRFPSTFLDSLPIQRRAIDNSFQKVNECVTLGEGVAWFPAFRSVFCIFSCLWLFASISGQVLPFQGFAITIIVLLWTNDQLGAETSVWQQTTLIRDEHLCPRRGFAYLQYKSIRSRLPGELFLECTG